MRQGPFQLRILQNSSKRDSAIWRGGDGWRTGVTHLQSMPQRTRREFKRGAVRLLTNHMRLILRYRQESLTDIKTTYPAKSKPTVPSVFRTTLNALIVSPSKLISRLLRCRLWEKGSVQKTKAGKTLISSAIHRELALCRYRRHEWA
jgi:hypothetical protein